MNDPSSHFQQSARSKWFWGILFIIGMLTIACAVLLHSKYSMAKVQGKPAIEWIHWRLAEENHGAFDEAVQVLGVDVWDYLENELSSRDNFLEHSWRKIYSKMPKGVFKQPKTADERILDGLILLEKLGPIPIQLQPSLVSIFNSNTNVRLFAIYAFRILGEYASELTATTIASTQTFLQETNDPTLKFAAYCLLLKKGIEPNLSDDDLVGLVPKLTELSGEELQWFICHSDADALSFWMAHLRRNDTMLTHLVTPRHISGILNPERKVLLLTAALDICEDLSSSSQNQILSAVSASWDLCDREVIEQRIIPTYLRALKSSNEYLPQTAARALVNFDPPPSLVIPSLQEAKLSNPHPEFFDQYITYFEQLELP